ncbi:MAG: hypothetical protein LWW75_07115 [Chlorobiales bacterium]|nr:hypothetical protein [Chlorobiales bacterium]
MPVLTKVTQLYVPEEDRICMTAEDRDGHSLAFWLTQRICRQLVPVLCRHLDRITPVRKIVSRDMQLACRQQHSEWHFQPSEPVRIENGARMVLPLKIDYVFTGELASLIFPAGGNENAELSLNAQELRQWLSIMYRLFRHAQWPTDVWPVWFAEVGQFQNR